MSAHSLLLRWQTAKRYVRTLGLIGLVYFGGTMTVILHWPIWLWLTVEGILRYVPLVAQVVLLVWLGWQLDVVQQWSLGSGILLLLGVQTVMFLARLPRSPFTQAAARLTVFALFIWICQRWWPTGSLSAGIQIASYAILLAVNLYRRMRG